MADEQDQAQEQEPPKRVIEVIEPLWRADGRVDAKTAASGAGISVKELDEKTKRGEARHIMEYGTPMYRIGEVREDFGKPPLPIDDPAVRKPRSHAEMIAVLNGKPEGPPKAPEPPRIDPNSNAAVARKIAEAYERRGYKGPGVS